MRGEVPRTTLGRIGCCLGQLVLVLCPERAHGKQLGGSARAAGAPVKADSKKPLCPPQTNFSANFIPLRRWGRGKSSLAMGELGVSLLGQALAAPLCPSCPRRLRKMPDADRQDFKPRVL